MACPLIYLLVFGNGAEDENSLLDAAHLTQRSGGLHAHLCFHRPILRDGLGAAGFLLLPLTLLLLLLRTYSANDCSSGGRSCFSRGRARSRM